MEVQFQKKEVPCLKNRLSQVQHLEQTQEVRIPEGMPGVQRILGVWGQILMRSKEWRNDTVQLSGGIQVWVLYEPEDGSRPQKLESWIPFQMHWDLEEGPEGRVRILPLLRSLDARLVSAGKIMIRAGIAALAEGWTENVGTLWQPGEIPGDLELLRSVWPVRIPKEIGEKIFELEEDLTLPASAPHPERIISCRMAPEISDRKVLGNKLLFRGNGNLHILYESEEEQLHSWDFALPFSQFAELEESLSTDAQGDIFPALTRLELEQDDEGHLHLNAGITAQYLVDDRELLELTEDAYSPLREVQVRQEQLELPVQLDSRRENIYGEMTLPVQADLVADISFLPDFPRQRRDGDEINLEQPGQIQVLYYDPEGKLQFLAGKWEGRLPLRADGSAQIKAVPLSAPVPQAMPGTESVVVRAESPVQVTAGAGQGMPMATGLTLGESRQSDPSRPSLILRRAENSRLWDIARESGSTVIAIRQANALTGDPEPNRMLLIPVVQAGS